MFDWFCRHSTELTIWRMILEKEVGFDLTCDVLHTTKYENHRAFMEECWTASMRGKRHLKEPTLRSKFIIDLCFGQYVEYTLVVVYIDKL